MVYIIRMVRQHKYHTDFQDRADQSLFDSGFIPKLESLSRSGGIQRVTPRIKALIAFGSQK